MEQALSPIRKQLVTPLVFMMLFYLWLYLVILITIAGHSRARLIITLFSPSASIASCSTVKTSHPQGSFLVSAILICSCPAMKVLNICSSRVLSLSSDVLQRSSCSLYCLELYIWKLTVCQNLFKKHKCPCEF